MDSLTNIYKLGQAFKTMYNLIQTCTTLDKHVQHWTTMYKLQQPNTILDINVLVQPCKTSLYGFLLSPVCGDYPFWVLYSLLVGLPFLGVGLVYPENVGHQLQRAVATDRGWS